MTWREFFSMNRPARPLTFADTLRIFDEWVKYKRERAL